MKDEFGGNKLISCTRGKAFQKRWQSKTISKGIGAEKHEDTEEMQGQDRPEDKLGIKWKEEKKL